MDWRRIDGVELLTDNRWREMKVRREVSFETAMALWSNGKTIICLFVYTDAEEEEFVFDGLALNLVDADGDALTGPQITEGRWFVEE